MNKMYSDYHLSAWCHPINVDDACILILCIMFSIEDIFIYSFQL